MAARTGQTVIWRDGSARQEIAQLAGARLQTPLDAQGAVMVALLNNPALQARFAGLGIAAADVAQAAMPGNPAMDAAFRLPVGGGPVMVDFGLVTDFVRLLTRGNATRAAKAELAAQQYHATDQALALALAAQTAFLGLQASEALLALEDERLAVAQAAHDYAAAQKRAGNVTVREEARLRLALAERQIAQTAAAQQKAAARAQLQQMMGLDAAAADWRIVAYSAPVPAVLDEDAGAQARTANLALAALRAELDAAALRAGLANRTAWIQSLQAGAAAERDEDGWSLGPSLSLPLPVFDQGQAVKARHRYHLMALAERYQAAIVAADAHMARAQADAAAVRDRLNLIETALAPAAAHLLAATVEAHNAMQADALALLAAKARQTAVRQEGVTARHDHGVAQARLGALIAGWSGAAFNESGTMQGAD